MDDKVVSLRVVKDKREENVPFFSIMDEKFEPIVSICLDGTVLRHREGKDAEAAKIFWDQVEYMGKYTANRQRGLEQELVAARTEIAQLREQLDGHLSSQPPAQ